jgi:hypothetical protein
VPKVFLAVIVGLIKGSGNWADRYISSMKRIMSSLGLLLATAIVPAQTTFEALYGGSGQDDALSVQQTADGGFILAGVQLTGPPLNLDMVVIKTDPFGVQEWSLILGTSPVEVATCVRQTVDGGYIVCGFEGGQGTSVDTLVLVRTDDQGGVLWEGRYMGGQQPSQGRCVRQTSDGGFIVCGQAGLFGATDVYVLKLDASGTEEWASIVDLGGNDVANAVFPLADGGFFVLSDQGIAGSNGDLHLLRFNDTGDTLWTRTFGTTDNDFASGLWATSDGGVVIAGGSGDQDDNVILIRTDPQGSLLWQQVFNDPGLDEWATSIQELDDGGFIVCGRKELIAGQQWAMSLFSTDVNGNVQWNRTFTQGVESAAAQLDRTTDGGYVLVGSNTAINNGTVTEDIYLVKTDGAGYSTVGGTTAKPFEVKVFPNPATDRVNIGLSSVGLTTASLVDPSGRTVWQDSFTGPGTYPLSIGHWCNGAYVLLFRTASGYRSQQRLVISR